jgi:hypothetical protein
LDTLALYVGELGRISAARIMLLVDPNRSRTLPPFLASNPGVNSGFMCWELTAVRVSSLDPSHSLPPSLLRPPWMLRIEPFPCQPLQKLPTLVLGKKIMSAWAALLLARQFRFELLAVLSSLSLSLCLLSLIPLSGG